MLRHIFESQKPEFNILLTEVLIGGAALGGALYEAGHANIPGAIGYIVTGFTGMVAVGTRNSVSS